MGYDYGTIARLCQGGKRPAHINPQVWRRMKKVGEDPRLMRIDPELLPTSLNALLELTKLPWERLVVLEKMGFLGPGMTAERVKEIGPLGPVIGLTEVTYDPDTDRVEIGAMAEASGPVRRAYQ
jgi:hypothetical protein